MSPISKPSLSLFYQNRSVYDNPHNIINNLSPEDAGAILRQLAAHDEKLAAKIAEIALSYLSDVEAEEITDALLAELEGLTPEDVWDRSGNTRYGYVETGEAAAQIIEELLEPYLAEMRQCQEAGLAREAQQLCRGLLLGFYLFEYKSKTAFKDWATDAPLAFAQEVLTAWQKGAEPDETRQEIREFIEAEMPNWAGNLLGYIK